MTMDIATLGIRVDATEARLAAVELDRLGAAGGRTATSMSAAERASERASHQFNAMAGMAKIAAGAIAGIVFSKVVQEVASFETKLLSLKALTNANTSEMKAMEKQARSLGASTAFSAQQTAEAQGVLASAGLKVNEILAATPKVLELAAAGALDLAKAAEISTGTMKGLGLELTDLGRINDVFAKVASDTSTNVEQVGEAMKNVAPIAKAFGINLEDMAASIGVLADNQIKGSEAGNNFKAMLTALGNETKERTNMLKQHGLAYSDLNIQVRGLQPVMDTLRKANLSGAEAITLFGSDAAAAGLILANNAPKIDTFSKALEGASGAAKAQADILNQGLAKAWDALLGTLSEASLQLGDSGLKGSLTDLIAAATGVISIYVGMGEEFAKSNNLTKEQYENLKNIASGLETVAAGAGGIAVLTAGIWAANAAMLAFNLASKANPLVLVATLGAAGIGMVIDKIGQQKKAQEDFMTSANTLDEQNLKIKTQIAKIVSLTPHGGGTGASKETMDIEKKNLEILIGQRTAIEAKTAAEKESAKVTDQANKNKPKDMPKLSGASTEELKAHEKAAKAAAKAQEALAKSFADTLEGLSLHNIELSKTTREHKEAELSAKGYTQAMVAQALALYDIGTALEAKKKLHEAEKSELDSLIDKYNQLTLSARDYKLTQLNAQGITGTDQAPIMAQFDKNTGAETAKKAQEDAKTTLDSYNKSLDDAKTKTSDLGAVTSAIFDGALGGISLMTGALTTMTDSLAENSKAMAELNKNQLLNNSISDPKEKAANFKKYAKEEATLNAKNVQDQMTGTRQLAGAASKMFAEKSAGAKAFHAIEVGIAVAQLAMRAKDMAMSAIATVKNIAEGASKLFAQSGWLGFAGVAAMLALMAGLGAMASGGGGGGSSTPPPSDTGTGTVLGDPTAVSESIGKTNDLLKTIHASEYVELRGINRGVNNLQQGISNTVSSIFRNGGLTSVTLAPSSITGMASVWNTMTLAAFDPISKFIGNFLFGGKVTRSVVGQGIATNATSLAGVMDGGNVSAQQYADIQTKTSGGLFTKAKTKYSTQYSAIGEDTQKALNQVFSSIGSTMFSVAKTLGNDLGINLEKSVMAAVIPAMRVDLMGLNGDDAAKKLNGVISATLDTMSDQLFGSIVGKYQQLGEGMLETTVRIVSEIAIVKDALKQSGLSITTDIVAVSDALVQAAGGLEAFQQQFESFFDKFYSDSEKQTRLQKTLVGSLAEANVILPTTRENYKKLVEGLNMTNPLDQQRYSLLLELSAAADTYYSMLESGAADAAKIAKTQRSLDIQYMELTGDAVGALTEKRKDELAAMDASLRITQQGVYILTDANKAVADATTAANKAVTDAMALASKAVSAAVNDVSKAISNLSSLAQKLRGALTGNTISTDATTRKDRADAQAVLNAALKVANAGGSIDNFAGMDKALTDISKPSEQLYATFTDYARDQALTSNTITQLADYADAQVSMAQQQIDAINNTTSAVNSVVGSLANLTEAQKTLATVEDQKAQIEKMLGNNLAVLSVSEAINQLAGALNAQNAATKAIALATAADKAATKADLALIQANTQATASALVYANARADWELRTRNANTAVTDSTAAIAKFTDALPAAKATYLYWANMNTDQGWNGAQRDSYTNSLNAAASNYTNISNNLTNAQSALVNANAAVVSAAAAGALLSGLSDTANADRSAADAALVTYQTARAYANATAAALPAFASGGQHEGGWRIVGENGPELEKTGASRIFSNPQSKSLLNMDELIAEQQALRADLRAALGAIANHTLRTAKILRDVTQDGTAITTVVAA